MKRGDIISFVEEGFNSPSEFRVLSSFVLEGKVFDHLKGREFVRVRKHGRLVVLDALTVTLVKTAEQCVAERLMA
jgi:UTP-glucose-1-phosphate uridylyltransferase